MSRKNRNGEDTNQVQVNTCVQMAQKCLQVCIHEENIEKCQHLITIYQQCCPTDPEKNHVEANNLDHSHRFPDDSFDIFKISH